MASISILLSREDEATLHRLAHARQDSEQAILASAAHDYLRSEAEQIAKIQAGISAADRGEFARDEEINTFFAKHGDAE